MTDPQEKAKIPAGNELLGETLNETAEKIMQSHLGALRETYSLLKQDEVKPFWKKWSMRTGFFSWASGTVF